MLWIDCVIVAGRSRGHSRYAARLEITTPTNAMPPSRHCRAANKTTANKANCGLTSAARITMSVTRPHWRRQSATRKTSAIGTTNPTELPRSKACHAGMAAMPHDTNTTTRSSPRAPRAAQPAGVKTAIVNASR